MPSEAGLCFAGPKNRGCKASVPTTRPCKVFSRFAEFVYEQGLSPVSVFKCGSGRMRASEAFPSGARGSPSAESGRSPGGLADILLESSVCADEGQRTVDRIRIYLLSHAQV